MNLENEFRNGGELAKRIRIELRAVDNIRLHRNYNLEQFHLADPKAFSAARGVRGQARQTRRSCRRSQHVTPRHLKFAHFSGLPPHENCTVWPLCQYGATDIWRDRPAKPDRRAQLAG